ncbi:MAG: phosphate transport system regulatory protein PhoU [Alkaliphilus sp.]|jgi:phosphate transport system protein|nr:phosphate signaling complex protein PhoU [bacterium AH-315-E09]PHS36090.1 MAG: phosphate transport system regulatory protein PhoU [Alkaliphilus sp.]
MRNVFEQQLQELNILLLKMGTMVQEIIECSVNALINQDLELAERIDSMDDKIDSLELIIEDKCMNLIALQQPMAKDLRVIATILKIITDLERMGDHAVNISRVTIKIGNEPFIKPLIDIPKMAKLTQEMVHSSLNAFTSRDIGLAKKIALDDDQVDDLYEKIYTELIKKMIQDKKIVEQATNLIFIGRYLERIADHSTNICERVIYMVTGELVEIN